MTTSATPGVGPGRVPLERLTLEFPRSLGVYDSYPDAQRAVDHLSDKDFPVQNVLIVGTDLKQVERVMGRLTWTKVVTGGILTGMWLGLFVGLIMSLFSPSASGSLATILSAVLTGAVFGAIWAGIGYAFTRGRRDFTSVTTVVATKYEVLVEHRVFDKAREILDQGGLTTGLASASSGAAGDGSAGAVAAQPNPYEGRYGAMREDTPERGSSGSTATVASPSRSDPTEPPDSPASRAQDDDRPQYGERLPEGTAPPQDQRHGDGGPPAPPNPRD